MESVKFGFVAAAVMGLSLSASAQQAAAWSNLDCSQSKIVAPAGLKCRATQEIAGSSNGRFNGNGLFKNWTATGTKDGAKLYYLVHEGVTINSNKQVFIPLQQEIKDVSPAARNGTNFTAPASMTGGDYSRFTGAGGESCVAIRKEGPVRGKGYQWVLFATKCVSAAKPLTDADIGQFISTADFQP